MEWKYLETEPFQMRCVMAAHMVRGCRWVVEIGGYKTPISNYLDEYAHTGTILIDPFLVDDSQISISGANVAHWFRQPFQEVDIFKIIGTSYFGLVILGMDIQGDLEPLYRLVARSWKTVIEFPPDYEPSVRQFEAIMANTNKRVKMQVNLDLSNNPMPDMSGSWHPRFIRNMYLLE